MCPNGASPPDIKGCERCPNIEQEASPPAKEHGQRLAAFLLEAQAYQRSRFVLAATEHLHRRIAKMSERVRELEDALAITQAKCSDHPHPLLIEGEIQAMKQDSPMSEQVPTGPRNMLDSFGMLNLSDHGASSTFFGPTGGSEVGNLRMRVCSCSANLSHSIYSWCVNALCIPVIRV